MKLMHSVAFYDARRASFEALAQLIYQDNELKS